MQRLLLELQHNNQLWQSTNSSNPCYWTCGSWKTLVWNDCVSENCSGTTPDWIAKKVSNATSTVWWTWNYNIISWKCTYTCGAEYHTEDSGNTCILNTRACAIVNWVWSQTWTTSWWTCSVVNCNANYSGPNCETYAAPIVQWKDIAWTTCTNDDITIWWKIWAGCNSVLWMD